jgi:iron complex transport system ATP-binding protein
VSTLSGGEAQKVFIAAGLAQDTSVLLLDEPTTFLDPRYQVEINRLLRRLNRDNGLTLLVVSHDINSALLNATHVLALRAGRAVFYGEARDLVNEKTLGEIFSTRFVLADHPTTGLPIVVPEQER